MTLSEDVNRILLLSFYISGVFLGVSFGMGIAVDYPPCDDVLIVPFCAYIVLTILCVWLVGVLKKIKKEGEEE